MHIVLFVLGLLVTAAGVAMAGFGIPISDFSFGNTLIVAGTIAIAGGLLLIAAAAVVLELKRIALKLSAKAYARADVRGDVRAEARGDVEADVLPAGGDTAHSLRSDAGRSDARSDMRSDLGRPDSIDPPAATPRGGASDLAPAQARIPFPSPRSEASIREMHPSEPKFTAAPSIEAPSEPLEWLRPKNGARAGKETQGSGSENREEVRPPSRGLRTDTPSAAYGSETGRQSFRSKPAGGFGETERTQRAEAPAARAPSAERPSRGLFDSVWPGERKPSSDSSPAGPLQPASSQPDVHVQPDRTEEPVAENSNEDQPAAPPERRPVAILKSGVIDGMAYTLYTDGSIEAQLPQGALKFDSINELRVHLEANEQSKN